MKKAWGKLVAIAMTATLIWSSNLMNLWMWVGIGSNTYGAFGSIVAGTGIVIALSICMMESDVGLSRRRVSVSGYIWVIVLLPFWPLLRNLNRSPDNGER